MSLTATYDSTLSRQRLAGTALGVSATYAVFDRTADGGITYTTVRGGTAVPVASQLANLDDYEFPPGVAVTYRVRSYNASNVLQATFTAGATQDLTQPWLKVPAAPFLNMPVEIVDAADKRRRSRSGVFDIKGRTNPVVVSDVASSWQYTLVLLTRTPAAYSNLDYLFASGEVLLLQLPFAESARLPAGYLAVIGDVSEQATLRRSNNRVWSAPVHQVAAPGSSVVGSAYTWGSVVADYATWSDLVAANATWSALLARTGTPSDVIVP